MKIRNWCLVVFTTSMLPLSLISHATEEATLDIESVNERLTKNDAKLKKRIKRLSQRITDNEKKFKIEGFLSAGFSISDEDGGTGHQPFNFNDEPDWQSDSVLGLQMSFVMDDKNKAVVQIVADGWSDWDPGISWAYLKHDFNESIDGKIGRMRIPLYFYSQSIDVGITYPFVRPPIELYTTAGAVNYDGAELNYTAKAFGFVHRMSIYGGRTKDYRIGSDAYDATGDDLYGINIRSSRGSWTTFLSWANIELVLRDIDSGIGFIDELFQYNNAGISYNDGVWFVVAEIAKRRAIDTDIAPTKGQFDLTIGRQFGKWMPYAIYGREYVVGKIPRGESEDEDYRSFSLGLKHNISPSISAKLEVNHYKIKNGAKPFDGAPVITNGGELTELNVVTFLIDAVF